MKRDLQEQDLEFETFWQKERKKQDRSITTKTMAR